MENTNTQETKDDDVKTELHTVCKNGYWEKFQVLVNNGANIKLLGKQDKTCLHFAAQGIFLFLLFFFSIPSF